MTITKKTLLILAALLLAALAIASPVAAQCGRGGHRGPGWYGQGWRAGFAMGQRAGKRLYNPESVTTVAGNVTAVEVEPARRGRAGGMHVTLSDAKATVVHIGPAWFAQAEGLIFTKGDKIEVTGSLVTVRDETYLIAREVKKADKVFKLREADGRPLWAASSWR